MCQPISGQDQIKVIPGSPEVSGLEIPQTNPKTLLFLGFLFLENLFNIFKNKLKL